MKISHYNTGVDLYSQSDDDKNNRAADIIEIILADPDSGICPGWAGGGWVGWGEGSAGGGCMHVQLIWFYELLISLRLSLPILTQVLALDGLGVGGGGRGWLLLLWWWLWWGCMHVQLIWFL